MRGESTISLDGALDEPVTTWLVNIPRGSLARIPAGPEIPDVAAFRIRVSRNRLPP